jgi:hypothetical protein
MSGGAEKRRRDHRYVVTRRLWGQAPDYSANGRTRQTPIERRYFKTKTAARRYADGPAWPAQVRKLGRKRR